MAGMEEWSAVPRISLLNSAKTGTRGAKRTKDEVGAASTAIVGRFRVTFRIELQMTFRLMRGRVSICLDQM